jgi:stress response protein YsnF
VTSSEEAHTTEVIPVAEERAHVEIKERVSDRVAVRIQVETRDEVIERELRDETLEIERIPVGREISEPPSTREQDGVLIVPVVEEELVVRTRLVLKEELRIRRVGRTRPDRQTVRLRREVAHVERPLANPQHKGDASDVNDE